MAIYDVQPRCQPRLLKALYQSSSPKTSIAVFLIGCILIVVWIKDITVLKSVLPGWVAIKANTAIYLILGGISLYPNRGLMMVMTSKNAGGMIARNLLPTAILFPIVMCLLVIAGYRMQIYSAEFGLCIFSILNVVVFAALIWWNARSLNIIDHQRRRSQTALKKANRKLEQRVSLHTIELSQTLEQLQHEIVQRQSIEQALFQEKEQSLVTLQSIRDGVITTDVNGVIKYINPAAEILIGWTLAEALELPLTAVFQTIDEVTHEAAENPIEKVLRSGVIVDLTDDTLLINRNGREFSIEHSAAPIQTSNGQIVGVVIVFHDITQSRNMARLLSWQTSHDELTGLLNRREFENVLAKSVSSAQTAQEKHALFYVDIDQFKIVNDSCGHIAGDELLCEVASLLQIHVPSSNTLARLSGDEFGILLNDCSLEAALLVANTICEAAQKFRFLWKQDQTFNLSVSIGLFEINADTPNINSALSSAEAACYVAKTQGRNRVHIYEADDLELARQHGEMQWVTRITQALEEDRFRLYYQCIVPVTHTESLTKHYEILLRLIDETGKLVSPMAFIPAAERYNLMQTIDRWVIETFFSHIAQCGDSQPHHFQLFENTHGCLYTINLSGASINDDQFIDFVCEQFALHQIPPQAICFEITETVAIKNLVKATGFIRALKEFGCCFALDDFGSGMSSLAYLKNLPVDYLKIDGSFVKHIVEEPIDLAMVDAINKIGQVMGIQTIAEFVENNAILEVLQTLGINYAQGYGVARPVPFYFN